MYLPPPTRRFLIGTLHHVQFRSGRSAGVSTDGGLRSGGEVGGVVMLGILSKRFARCQ
jgi:hypothetical protein